MSARFLLATIDGGGTVPPELGLASRLVRHGHTVRVLGDPTLERSAAAAGCAFSAWQRAPHVATVEEQTALIRDMERRNPLRQFAFARDRLICGPARDFAADLVRTVREHPADALLVEAAVAGALIGAEATGLPTAALMPNIYLRPAKGLPPFGTGWSPARGPLGRGRDVVVAAALRKLFATGLPALNAARTEFGLPPIDDLYALLDACSRVLVMTSPSFDFPAHALPPNVRYVGPQLDDPAWATGTDWRPDGDAPLVLVAMSSTFQAQIDALRRIAAGLGRLHVRALLTTGPAIAPHQVPAPPNVRVLRAAPHSEVLPEASAVITHAGHGSVLKALAAGVPLVCMPLGRDQKDNTVRVLRLGAGVRVPKQASVERIVTAVRQILDQPSYRHAAHRFAETLAMEAATRPSAIDEAEALLQRCVRPPREGGHRPGPG
jgi:MGT family glycosyltransferase